MDTRQKEHHEAVEDRRRREEKELEAEEEISRKVECPTCGSAATLKCRVTGASRGLRKKSHTARPSEAAQQWPMTTDDDR
ncbi:zinc finger domain-containing protein [Streptomyces albogriseolus]|uniref:zinc finger domain-containing protein n=1 Tax=Streptomyces albogriseolus TaxID=1887 RepID=UPI003F4A25B1